MFSGERMKQAREIRGLTQSELAEAARIDQSHVSLLEQNAREPSDPVVQAVALQTGFPQSFFRQAGSPELPLGSLLFRRRQALRSKDRDRVRQLARLVLEMVEEITQQLRIPQPSLPRLVEEPAVAAQVTRTALGLSPDAPVDRLVRRLERAGVLVLAVPLDVPEIDAFSVWTDGEPRKPAVVLCGERPGDRQRFSLAHELGHLVLHQTFNADLATVEDAADEFAGEFLLPGEAMRREVTLPVTLTRLAELKARWGVSMQAITMRAGALGIITERQKKYLFQQLSARGWRKKEPVQVPAEKPRLLRKAAEVRYGVPPDNAKLAQTLSIPSKLVGEILACYATRDDLAPKHATTPDDAPEPTAPRTGRLVGFRPIRGAGT